MSSLLSDFIDLYRPKIEHTLSTYLKFDEGVQCKLAESMRYSALNPGKRLRSILLLLGYFIAGGKDLDDVLSASVAVEMIHVYSLIHDDLPSMDDDDWRRGKYSNHKVFGEGLAILTGDAFLTQSFSLLSQNAIKLNLNVCALDHIIQMVVSSSGIHGMVSGQALDLEMQHGIFQKLSQEKRKNVLFKLHSQKTAGLICASLVVGAILGGMQDAQLQALKRYGDNIGLSFQIMDDIFDITRSQEALGKSISDIKNEKLTYTAIYGLEESKKKAIALMMQAKDDLSCFEDTEPKFILQQATDYIIKR